MAEHIERPRPQPRNLIGYVVEYDENSVAWLVHVDDGSRVALEHGMVLIVEERQARRRHG